MIYKVLWCTMLPIKPDSCAGFFYIYLTTHWTNNFTPHPKDEASWLSVLLQGQIVTTGTQTHSLWSETTKLEFRVLIWIIVKLLLRDFHAVLWQTTTRHENLLKATSQLFKVREMLAYILSIFTINREYSTSPLRPSLASIDSRIYLINILNGQHCRVTRYIIGKHTTKHWNKNIKKIQ